MDWTPVIVGGSLLAVALLFAYFGSRRNRKKGPSDGFYPARHGEIEAGGKSRTQQV